MSKTTLACAFFAVACGLGSVVWGSVVFLAPHPGVPIALLVLAILSAGIGNILLYLAIKEWDHGTRQASSDHLRTGASYTALPPANLATGTGATDGAAAGSAGARKGTRVAVTGYKGLLLERSSEAAWVLRSAYDGSLWQRFPPRLTAACHSHMGDLVIHADPPREDCTCGIYARRDPQGQQTMILAPTVLVGVKLWGKIIEYEEGYRAEHAVVDAIIVDYTALDVLKETWVMTHQAGLKRLREELQPAADYFQVPLVPYEVAVRAAALQERAEDL